MLDTITTMFWSDFPNICMNIAKKEENYNSTIASSSKTFKKLQKVTKSYKKLARVSKKLARVSKLVNKVSQEL